MDAPNESTVHDDLLRRYLESTSAACPVCAYDLHALTSRNCPECGAALELRVGSADLRLGLWLTALFSVGLPFGFFAIFLVLAIVMSFIRGIGGPPPTAWFALVLGSIVFGAASLILCRFRRTFWRRRRRRQAGLAALTAVASVLGTIAVMLVMFSDTGL